jgi:2-methylcitrate dehydratase
MKKGNMDEELEAMSAFVHDFSLTNLADKTIERLKIHLFDSLGCALGALAGPPVIAQRELIVELGGAPQATLLGSGNKTSVDRAALNNTALIRYLDFMDNFIAKHGTCHPSDNIGTILAVCEWKDLPGYSLLEAMAVAYNVQCRMIQAEPSMDRGFDHTTQLAFSVAAGAGKALRLGITHMVHAIALAGSSFNPFVVIRAPRTSQWKGLISSQIAFGALNCCLLAQKGVTGPLDLFTGAGGYNENFGIKRSPEWMNLREDIFSTLTLKKYNAEVHTQTAIQAVLNLRELEKIQPAQISAIDLKIFQTAYDITGGGKYGPRDEVYTKEDADHSLPYLIAVALLDGQVLPSQFEAARINSSDVQELLQKVHVGMKMPFSKPKKLSERLDPFTRHYPEKLMCEIQISLADGRKVERKEESFHGFYDDPLTWDDAMDKFRVTCPHIREEHLQRIVRIIKALESHSTRDLIDTLLVAANSRNVS